MLNLEQIIQFAEQEGLGADKARFALAEYLQCVILKIIFTTSHSKLLSFIGGTSLRFFYHLPRFSEDLDFDNLGINESDFEDMMQIIKRELEAQGFSVDSVIKFKGAYHCYIRFANLLFEHRLSPYATEKILIKIDMTKNEFPLEPENRFFNRYGIVEEVRVNRVDILMAQKTIALLERKRAKGRDFFDFIFLDGLAKPNLKYLQYNGIANFAVLKEKMLARCAELNFDSLANEVKPFLFNPADIIRVSKFEQYIKQWQV